MTISFDLDGTLIPLCINDFPTEERTILQKLLGTEPIRKETADLFKQLRKLGHQPGIYTTSYRSSFSIRTWLWTYGISADFIINEDMNRKQLSTLGLSCSKYPPAFNIDIHVDDSKGVEMEGKKFNFRTILVNKEEEGWLQKIIKECNKDCDKIS